ncbi:uncharacterized protein SOCE836_026130 [Sorangium cellulosum]|uniref:Uncharacterized protein n=1 Tax=Sorangium cellulosum TaxID=56 RepID=A0A4P2QKE0_SORCE|nr:uncharacterized protein SOCE836_026130 [Sorangium cellulosum]WCQ89901.1 hypothetical protein NQZ70_02599 [Sorangium sp. Soce836]
MACEARSALPRSYVLELLRVELGVARSSSGSSASPGRARGARRRQVELGELGVARSSSGSSASPGRARVSTLRMPAAGLESSAYLGRRNSVSDKTARRVATCRTFAGHAGATGRALPPRSPHSAWGLLQSCGKALVNVCHGRLSRSWAEVLLRRRHAGVVVVENEGTALGYARSDLRHIHGKTTASLCERSDSLTSNYCWSRKLAAPPGNRRRSCGDMVRMNKPPSRRRGGAKATLPRPIVPTHGQSALLAEFRTVRDRVEKLIGRASRLSGYRGHLPEGSRSADRVFPLARFGCTLRDAR